MQDQNQALHEKVAELFGDDTPISTTVESPPATNAKQQSAEEPVSEATPGEITDTGAPVTSKAGQPDAILAGLDTDTAIRLRWALRDIRAKRTQLSPVDPGDLRTLIEMGLVETHDDVPVLTNEGHQALD
jgi:hypothetical protein